MRYAGFAIDNKWVFSLGEPVRKIGLACFERNLYWYISFRKKALVIYRRTVFADSE